MLENAKWLKFGGESGELWGEIVSTKGREQKETGD